MSLHQTELNPPDSPDRFEQLCLRLYSKFLSSSDLRLHGVSGQAQFGVDIFGTNDKGVTVGIQCKQRKQRSSKQLTVSDVDDEIAKAEKFEPSLGEFVIATSARRDGAIQRHVAKLSAERRKQGYFLVRIDFWEDLAEMVKDSIDIYAEFFPHDVEAQEIVARSHPSPTAESRLIVEDPFSKDLSAAQDPIPTKQLDKAKELLADGEGGKAYELLKLLLGDVDGFRHPYTRFRLYANLGSACLTVDTTTEAVSWFKRAWRESRCERAWANYGLALLLENRVDEAKSLVSSLISECEEPIDAVWSLFAQTHSLEECLSEDRFVKWVDDESQGKRLLAHKYQESGDIDYAIKLLVSAESGSTRALETAILKIFRAHAQLSRLGNEINERRSAGINIDQRQQAENCVALYDQALIVIPDASYPGLRAEALRNRGVACRILSRHKEAAISLRSSLDIEYNDLALWHSFCCSIEAKDYDYAKELWDRNRKYLLEKCPDLFIDIAALLWSVEEIDVSVDIGFDDLLQKLSGHNLVSFALVYSTKPDRTGEQYQILEIAKALDDKSPGAGRWFLDATGNVGSDESQVTEEDLSDDEENFELQLPLYHQVIEARMTVGRFDCAYRLLNALHERIEGEGLLSKLIIAAYHSDRSLVADELIKQTSPGSHDPESALHIVDVLLKFGHLARATEWLFTLYESDDITDSEYWLRRANIALREQDQKALEDASSRLQERAPKNLIELDQVSKVILAATRDEEALDYVLLWRQRFLSDVRYHVLIFTLSMSTESDASDIERPRIEEGVGVRVSLNSDTEKRYFVGSDERFADIQLDPNSGLGNALNGLKKGECCSLDSSGGINDPITYKVERIMSPRTLAFEDSLSRCEEGTWEETGVTAVSMLDLMGGRPNDGINNGLQKVALDRKQNEDYVLDCVDKGKLTYFIAAQALGKDLFEFLSNISAGLHRWRNQVPSQYPDGVVDGSVNIVVPTLSTITMLFVMEKVGSFLEDCEAAGCHVFLPRRLQDFFINKNQEYQLMLKKVVGYAGLSGESMRVVEADRIALEKKADYMARVCELLERHCEIISGAVASKMRSHEYEWDTYIGSEDAASRYLASQNGRLLLIEDSMAAQLLVAEDGISISNIGSLYSFWAERELVDVMRRDEIHLGLIKVGATGASVSGSVIWQSLMDGLFEGDIYFERCCSILASVFDRDWDIGFTILLNFLQLLWRSDRDHKFKTEYTDLASIRCSDSVASEANVNKALLRVRREFYLEPIACKEIEERIVRANMDRVQT